MIHRDIKPENVVLTPSGRTLLTDFGLAKAYLDSTRLGKTLVERSTNLYGTVEYMAPEQVEARTSGPATDIFSLGATLYAVAVGRSPFTEETPILVMEKIAGLDYSPLAEQRPDLSEACCEMIGSMLRLEPGERPTAATVQARSHQWLTDHHQTDINTVVGEFVGPLPEPSNLPDDPAQSSPQGPDGPTARDLDLAALKPYVDRGQPQPPKGLRHNDLAPPQVETSPMPDDEATHGGPGSRRPGAWWLVVLLVLVCLAFLAGLFTPQQSGSRRSAQRPSPASPPPAPTPVELTPVEPTALSRLEVRVEPWADVYLDGQPVGRTPQVSEMFAEPGPHTVTVVHPRLGQRSLVVNFGQEERVMFILE